MVDLATTWLCHQESSLRFPYILPLEASAPIRPSPNGYVCAATSAPTLWYSRSSFTGFFAPRKSFQDKIVWMVLNLQRLNSCQPVSN